MDYKEQLEALTKKWIKLLRLSSWDWAICITEDMVTGPHTNMEVIIRDEDGEFQINALPYDKLDVKDLNSLILHELLHVLLYRLLPEKMSKSALKEEERVVNNITRAFVKLEEQKSASTSEK